MAYNKSSNPLDPTGVSILVQVAFKGAIEVSKNGGDGLDVVAFAENFPMLTDALIDQVATSVAEKAVTVETAPAKKTATQRTARTAEDAIRDELGGTDESGDSIRVLGDQHGDLPGWFLTAAKAKGVTKVFDNRARREETGKNLPWFVTPQDADEYGEPADCPFWPPKKK